MPKVTEEYIENKKKLNYQKEHYKDLLFPLISDTETVAAMAEANLKQMDDFL